MIEKPNFFVFTGGPGVGKTTLLHHLRAMGETVVEENARAVIRENMEIGGPAVPWIDNDAFVEQTAARDIANFDRLAGEMRRVFFDRGIADSYGANGARPSASLIQAIGSRRYNRHVFLFPAWREIYETDTERKQDWEEAEATFDKIIRLLPQFDYEPVIVPKGDLATRAAFVLGVALRAAASPP